MFSFHTAPVPRDVRPEAGRDAVPDGRVLLQIRRAHTVRARHMAHVRRARRLRTLPRHTTPPLSRTKTIKTARISIELSSYFCILTRPQGHRLNNLGGTRRTFVRQSVALSGHLTCIANTLRSRMDDWTNLMNVSRVCDLLDEAHPTKIVNVKM